MKLRYFRLDKREVYDDSVLMTIPWDPENDQPLDIDGEIGRIWEAAGRPKPAPIETPGEPRPLELLRNVVIR